MKNIYLGFKFAFSYFTILPVSFESTDNLSNKQTIKSLLFFLPLVGLIIGLLSTSIYIILENLTWLGAIIGAIGYMILYGFLHTEAIVDVADALYAKHSGKNAYEIIKEPTVGAMGLLFGISFVILKIALVVYAFQLNLLVEFLTILIVSRFALLLNIKLFDTHTKSSFIQLMKDNLSYIYLFIIFIIYSLIGFTLVSNNIFIILLSVILISLIVVKVLKEKLGFVNGDILGTSLEISEIVGLFIIILLFI